MSLIVPQTWLRRVAQVILTVIILFFIGRLIVNQWDEIRNIFTHLSWSWFVLSVVSLIPIILLQVYIWFRLMKAQFPQLTFVAGVSIYFQSFITRYIPGGVWPFLARTWHAKKIGIPKELSIFVILMESVIALGSASAVFLVIPHAATNMPILTLGAAICTLLCGVFLWRYPQLTSLVGLMMRRTIRPIIIPPMTIISSVLWYGITWMVSGLWFLLVFRSTGLALELNVVWSLAAFYALSWAVGFIVIIIPSGIGVRELAMLVLFGLIAPTPVVIVILVLARLILLITECVLFGVTFALPRQKNKILQVPSQTGDPRDV